MSNHTDSYKGFRVYQELVSKRPNRQILQNSQIRIDFLINSREYPQLGTTQNKDLNQNQFNVSYSDTFKNQKL